MLSEHRSKDDAEPERFSRMNRDAFRDGRELAPGRLLHIGLDLAHGLIGFLAPAMCHQPTRALGHKATQHQNGKAEHAADSKTQPPSNVDGKQALIEQQRRDRRTSRRTDPETAVDDEIDATAVFRRDQFVDRGIHGRVFAADPHSGQHAKQGKAQEIPGAGAQQHASQINDQRRIKHQPTSEAISNPSRHHCAGDRADNIKRSNGAQI